MVTVPINDNIESLYGLTREEASELLGISSRTLDRYIRHDVLSSQKVKGRVMLSKDEVLDIKQNGTHQPRPISRPIVVNAENAESNEKALSIIGKNVFKEVFNEVKKDIDEYQEKLEMANYRLGQMEVQLKNSVPLSEHQREKFLLQSDSSKREQEKQLMEAKSENLREQLKTEILNKYIFAGLLFSALALQVLWVIMQS